MANIVKLNKSAFIGMLTTCLEVYKKEGYGVLLGETRNGHSFLRSSINYQNAKRTYDYVNLPSVHENRMKKTLGYISNQKMIGDFHSHSDFPDTLSRHDRKDLLKMKNKWVSMLLVIWNTKKRTPWAYNRKEKYVSGSIGRKYFVKMHAYKNVEGRVEKVKIECPYIKRINESHF